MSDETVSRLTTIAVVGGGITGLSATLRLQDLNRDLGGSIRIRLLESDNRLGGNIRTERFEGCLLEGGPDQFVRHKPAGLDLCSRLGLDDQLVEIDARSTATHVVRDGRPVRLPRGFTLMGPTRLLPAIQSSFFSWHGKARMACEPLIAPRPEGGDESLASFITRRFGRELLDRVFEPVFGGIFTADADRLSLEMTVPQLLQLEREHGSILKAMRRRAGGKPAGASRSAARRAGCVTLEQGLGQLVEQIVARLPSEAILTGARVERLGFDRGSRRWKLAIAGRPELEADGVILAVPAHVSARLLDWDDGLAGELARLEYASCATVNLGYRPEAFRRLPDSFGFFVGRTENLPILACSHVSVKYPNRVPRDRVVLRAHLGGARHPELLARDDDELAELAHGSLARLLQIGDDPVFHRVHRFPAAIPQYPVGYRSRMKSIVERAQRHAGLVLCGGVLGAVGLPDCVASGEAAARQAAEHVGAPLTVGFDGPRCAGYTAAGGRA